MELGALGGTGWNWEHWGHCMELGGSARHWEHWFVLGSNGDTGGSEGHWEHWFVLVSTGDTGQQSETLVCTGWHGVELGALVWHWFPLRTLGGSVGSTGLY